MIGWGTQGTPWITGKFYFDLLVGYRKTYVNNNSLSHVFVLCGVWYYASVLYFIIKYNKY